MNKYVVFTSLGDYHVYARTVLEAKDKVFRLTFGRVPLTSMTVEARQ